MKFFDVLTDTLPDYDDSDPFEPDGIYAYVEVPYGNPAANKKFFHLLLTEEQLNYRHKLDLDAPGQSDPFSKSIKKANKKWTKEVRKSDGELVSSPMHVFGTSTLDFETGERLTPDDKPNQIIKEDIWVYEEPSATVLNAIANKKSQVNT